MSFWLGLCLLGLTPTWVSGHYLYLDWHIDRSLIFIKNDKGLITFVNERNHPSDIGTSCEAAMMPMLSEYIPYLKCVKGGPLNLPSIISLDPQFVHDPVNNNWFFQDGTFLRMCNEGCLKTKVFMFPPPILSFRVDGQRGYIFVQSQESQDVTDVYVLDRYSVDTGELKRVYENDYPFVFNLDQPLGLIYIARNSYRSFEVVTITYNGRPVSRVKAHTHSKAQLEEIMYVNSYEYVIFRTSHAIYRMHTKTHDVDKLDVFKDVVIATSAKEPNLFSSVCVASSTHCSKQLCWATTNHWLEPNCVCDIESAMTSTGKCEELDVKNLFFIARSESRMQVFTLSGDLVVNVTLRSNGPDAPEMFHDGFFCSLLPAEDDKLSAYCRYFLTPNSFHTLEPVTFLKNEGAIRFVWSSTAPGVFIYNGETRVIFCDLQMDRCRHLFFTEEAADMKVDTERKLFFFATPADDPTTLTVKSTKGDKSLEIFKTKRIHSYSLSTDEKRLVVRHTDEKGKSVATVITYKGKVIGDIASSTLFKDSSAVIYRNKLVLVGNSKGVTAIETNTGVSYLLPMKVDPSLTEIYLKEIQVPIQSNPCHQGNGGCGLKLCFDDGVCLRPDIV